MQTKNENEMMTAMCSTFHIASLNWRQFKFFFLIWEMKKLDDIQFIHSNLYLKKTKKKNKQNAHTHKKQQDINIYQ